MKHDDALTKPFAHYVHARPAGGLLFLAGQGCRDPQSNQCVGLSKDDSGKIVSYDIGIQTHGVIKNIQRALAQHQLKLDDLIDVTVFLTSMADFAAMNQVWNEYFSGQDAPTRTTVAVKELPGENFVEMKAIAAFNHARQGSTHDV